MLSLRANYLVTLDPLGETVFTKYDVTTLEEHPFNQQATVLLTIDLIASATEGFSIGFWYEAVLQLKTMPCL